MIFLRVVAILCGTAILLALAGDIAVFVLIQRLGGFLISARKGMPVWFPSPFTIIFSGLWIAALIIGLLIAKKLRVFPYVL